MFHLLKCVKLASGRVYHHRPAINNYKELLNNAKYMSSESAALLQVQNDAVYSYVYMHRGVHFHL